MVGVPGSSTAATSGDEGGYKSSVLCGGVYSRLHPDKAVNFRNTYHEARQTSMFLFYIAMTMTSHSTSSSPGFLRSLVPLGHSYFTIPSPSCKSFIIIADPPSITFFTIYFTMAFCFPLPFPRIHYPLLFPSAVLRHWVGAQLAIVSSHLNTYSIMTSFCTFSSNHILVQFLAWGGLYGV